MRTLLLGAYGIHARPKARKSGGGTTLDYNRRESARDSRCIQASLEQDARVPKKEVSGVDTTGHLLLGEKSTIVFKLSVAKNHEIVGVKAP